MLVSGIMIAYLLGLAVIYLCLQKISLLEYIGLSFMLGMGGITVIMFFLDIVGLTISLTNIFILSGTVVAGAIFKFIKSKDSFKFSRPESLEFKNINLVWILLIVLIVILEYYNFSKCLFFPTHERDSVAGFEGIGYIIANEHTIRNLSIFQGDYVTGIDMAESYINYIPMVQLCHAYPYMLGAELSKIVPGLLFLHFIIALYGAARNYVNLTAAAIITLCTIATPDLMAFSSLSGTNVINAIFASLGIIYTILWLIKDDKVFFRLAIIMNALGLWSRNESVVFVFAAGIIVAITLWKSKRYKEIIKYILYSLSPLVIWGVYMKLFLIPTDSFIILKPFWDPQKISDIWRYFMVLMKSTTSYGITFYLFIGIILLNIKSIVKRRDLLNLLGIIFISITFYLLLLYQIDYNKFDKLENVVSVSTKRFMFCYIPLVWFYIFANRSAGLIFNKLQQWMCLKR